MAAWWLGNLNVEMKIIGCTMLQVVRCCHDDNGGRNDVW